MAYGVIDVNLPEVVEAADNDNDPLVPDWMTKAEFVQWLHAKRERLRRELREDPSLLSSSEHRLDWDILEAMERCGRWHLFGDRRPS